LVIGQQNDFQKHSFDLTPIKHMQYKTIEIEFVSQVLYLMNGY